MRILPKEKYSELHDWIERVRLEYPYTHFTLRTIGNRISLWIEENSRILMKEDLIDGKKYGYFTVSETATAISPKEGRWMLNHGDLYIVCWKWSDEIQKFYCENAWGVIEKMNPAVIRHPIIELP